MSKGRQNSVKVNNILINLVVKFQRANEKDRNKIFEEIYKRSKKLVRGYAYAYINSQNLWDVIHKYNIDDIVQGVFKKLRPRGRNRGILNIKDPSATKKYMRVTTINSINSLVQKELKRKTADTEFYEWYKYIRYYRTSPDKIMQRDELRLIINNVVDELADDDWKSGHIINEIYWGDRELSDIARSMDMNYKSGWDITQHDYKRMKEILKERYSIKGIDDLLLKNEFF